MHHFIIPHKYVTGKSSRKITANSILSMHWAKRQDIHDQYLVEMGDILKDISSRRDADIRYKVSFGFVAGKSTKILDLDNLLWPIAKWAIDAFRKHMGINDDFNTIIEVRICFLGREKDEKVVMQIEETKDLVIERRKKEVIDAPVV